jgi:hypothetical protein
MFPKKRKSGYIDFCFRPELFRAPVKHFLIIYLITLFFTACRAEYETVVQNQVVTEVVQNSKGTYRINARALGGTRPINKTKITPGDTLQCMVLRRIK